MKILSNYFSGDKNIGERAAKATCVKNLSELMGKFVCKDSNGLEIAFKSYALDEYPNQTFVREHIDIDFLKHYCSEDKTTYYEFVGLEGKRVFKSYEEMFYFLCTIGARIMELDVTLEPENEFAANNTKITVSV